MEAIGLSLVVGGAALVASGLTFLLPKRNQRSPDRATTDESLQTINHYLSEIRQQRNDYTEQRLSNPMR